MKRVLIIDNDPSFEADVRKRLEQLQLSVSTVTDGVKGLDQAKSDPPDLILLAAELENMSGYSVCNKIRRNKNLESVPLMIVSSGETPETFEQHQHHKNRADEYLLKDGNAETVASRIAAMLGIDDQPAGTAPGTAPVVEEAFEDAFDAITDSALHPQAGELDPFDQDGPPPVVATAPAPARDGELDAVFDQLTDPEDTAQPAPAAPATPPPPPPRKKKVDDDFGFDGKLSFLRKTLKKRERELDSARKEQKNARARVNEVEQEMKKLTDHTRAQRKQIGQLNKQNASLAQDLARAKQDLEEVGNQLEDSVRRFEEERGVLNAKIEEQENKLKVLQETFQMLTQKRTEENQENEEQLGDASKKIELLQESLDEVTREKEEREAELNQEVEVERGRADLLQESLDAVTDEKEGLEKRIAELDNALEENLEKIRNTMADFESERGDLRGQIAEWSERHTALSRDFDQYKNESQQENERLQNDIAEEKNRFEALRASAESAADEHAGTEQELNLAREQISLFEGELGTTRGDLENAVQREQTLTGQYKEIRAKFAKAQKYNKEFQAEVKRMQEALSDRQRMFESTVNAKDKMIAERDEAISQRDEIISQLQATTEAKDDVLGGLEADVGMLRGEVDMAQEETAQARVSLEKAERRFAELEENRQQLEERGTEQQVSMVEARQSLQQEIEYLTRQHQDQISQFEAAGKAQVERLQAEIMQTRKKAEEDRRTALEKLKAISDKKLARYQEAIEQAKVRLLAMKNKLEQAKQEEQRLRTREKKMMAAVKQAQDLVKAHKERKS